MRVGEVSFDDPLPLAQVPVDEAIAKAIERFLEVGDDLDTWPQISDDSDTDSTAAVHLMNEVEGAATMRVSISSIDASYALGSVSSDDAAFGWSSSQWMTWAHSLQPESGTSDTMGKTSI